MSEMEKHYNPQEVDKKWYRVWEEAGHFKADPRSKKPPYCIVMPPPNVTGVLHMGHALVSSIQDILIRWKRMSGFEALWVPGVDHAGIATQTVVERQLINTTGKRRKEIGREAFLERVWEWKKEKEEVIHEQLRALGSSCDWDRYRFTMDQASNRAVRTFFKKLFDQGLIYQGDYLVNWDPVTQTALADDEVEYIERMSSIWTIRYPLSDGSGSVLVATTRPETMLGDTAVAVAPGDERYKHLIGKTVTLPITGREVPIIADQHVNPEFGTGVVKITPAHDPNDYQMGINHDLEMINIMTPDGRVNEVGGEFQGMTMEEARHAVADKLAALGLLEKTEKHTHRVGISYRSKAVIEPHLSKQWFVKMDGFAKRLHEIVSNGEVKIIPKSWENTYFHWIDNLRDWCISRQLWWGHRIPIWYSVADPKQMICYDGDGLPPEVEANPDAWKQDPDALDTWFSSALWPFSTLGWPDNTEHLETFYPNSVLVTGHDILFFWVARMILAGDAILEKPPFPETFLHGLVYGRSYWRNDPDGGISYVSQEERLRYDKGETPPKDVHSKWEKLSKSKGNVIDPYEIINEYGTDAMRMALCASSPQNSQIDLDRRRFEEFRNFTNKIWNGARFVMMNLEEFTPKLTDDLQLEDRWILSVMDRTVQSVTDSLGSYSFDHAANTAYDFFWKEFCAYYVEAVKPSLFGKTGTPEEKQNKQTILLIVLTAAIRLLHPMAPFITEELFSLLKTKTPKTTSDNPYLKECLEALSAEHCMVAPYPTPIEKPNDAIEAKFDHIQELIYTIRNIRGEMKIPPGQATDIYLIGERIKDDHLLHALLRIKELHIVDTPPDLPFSSTGVIGNTTILIPLPEELQAQEKTRLTKQAEKLAKSIEGTQKRLQNPAFLEKAPDHLVAETKSQLTKLKTELQEIQRKITN